MVLVQLVSGAQLSQGHSYSRISSLPDSGIRKDVKYEALTREATRREIDSPQHFLCRLLAGGWRDWLTLYLLTLQDDPVNTKPNSMGPQSQGL